MKNVVQVTLTLYPEDLERWKQKAKADSRTLSQWVRMRLLAADARDEELATRMAELKDSR
jgi:hypothetical protein